MTSNIWRYGRVGSETVVRTALIYNCIQSGLYTGTVHSDRQQRRFPQESTLQDRIRNHNWNGFRVLSRWFGRKILILKYKKRNSRETVPLSTCTENYNYEFLSSVLLCMLLHKDLLVRRPYFYSSHFRLVHWKAGKLSLPLISTLHRGVTASSSCLLPY